MFFKNAVCVAVFAASLATAPSVFADDFSGKSVTKGGSKPFCKGSTSISASVNKDRISIETPLAAGGSATVKGKIDKAGMFKASGSRFAFSGKVKGASISGTWKGPSCYGSFSLRG